MKQFLTLVILLAIVVSWSPPEIQAETGETIHQQTFDQAPVVIDFIEIDFVMAENDGIAVASLERIYFFTNGESLTDLSRNAEHWRDYAMTRPIFDKADSLNKTSRLIRPFDDDWLLSHDGNLLTLRSPEEEHSCFFLFIPDQAIFIQPDIAPTGCRSLAQ